MNDDLGVPIKLTFKQKMTNLLILMILLALSAYGFIGRLKDGPNRKIDTSGVNLGYNISGTISDLEAHSKYIDVEIEDDDNGQTIHLYVYSSLRTKVAEADIGYHIKASGYRISRRKVTAYKAKKIIITKPKSEFDYEF